MKKLGLLLLTLTLLLRVCGCSYQDPVLAALPDYKSKVFYTSGGFQDSTDYAKFTYESVTAQDLKESKFFSETTTDDVEEILLHIDNFEDWVETIGEELKQNYDFDKNIVSEGDFFYIKLIVCSLPNRFPIFCFDVEEISLGHNVFVKVVIIF